MRREPRERKKERERRGGGEGVREGGPHIWKLSPPQLRHITWPVAQQNLGAPKEDVATVHPAHHNGDD